MGSSMAMHLLKAGYEVSVFSRTREKAVGLEAAGAVWRNSPAEIAEASQVIFTILGFPHDVESVLLGNQGVIEGVQQGSIVVDMTTSCPELAVRVDSRFKSQHVIAIDAPVSGGDIGARDGTLAIMCGGCREGYVRTQPLMATMGSDVQWFGPAGSGQRAKMSNQIVIASTMMGTVEGLLYAERAGLDLLKVIELLSQGAAGSWSLSKLGPRIAEGDWEPGFFIKHFVKDMEIALADATRMGLKLKGLELAHEFYREAKKMNLEEKGTQALYQVLRSLNKCQ